MKTSKNNNTKSYSNTRSVQGFTLIELLVALIISSVILTVAAYGTISLFQSENKLNRKNNIRSEITRAFAYLQEEINSAASVDIDNSGDCSNFADSSCLKLNNNDGSTILYGFKDISSITSSNNLYKWLKPGLLRRREKPSGGSYGNAQVLVDGLAISGTTAPTCTFGTTVNNSGEGFQFCLPPDDVDFDGDGIDDSTRRVQIFLFGYTGKGSENTPIKLSNLAFTKSNPI